MEFSSVNTMNGSNKAPPSVHQHKHSLLEQALLASPPTAAYSTDVQSSPESAPLSPGIHEPTRQRRTSSIGAENHVAALEHLLSAQATTITTLQHRIHELQTENQLLKSRMSDMSNIVLLATQGASAMPTPKVGLSRLTSEEVWEHHDGSALPEQVFQPRQTSRPSPTVTLPGLRMARHNSSGYQPKEVLDAGMSSWEKEPTPLPVAPRSPVKLHLGDASPVMPSRSIRQHARVLSNSFSDISVSQPASSTVLPQILNNNTQIPLAASVQLPQIRRTVTDRQDSLLRMAMHSAAAHHQSQPSMSPQPPTASLRLQTLHNITAAEQARSQPPMTRTLEDGAGQLLASANWSDTTIPIRRLQPMPPQQSPHVAAPRSLLPSYTSSPVPSTPQVAVARLIGGGRRSPVVHNQSSASRPSSPTANRSADTTHLTRSPTRKRIVTLTPSIGGLVDVYEIQGSSYSSSSQASSPRVVAHSQDPPSPDDVVTSRSRADSGAGMASPLHIARKLNDTDDPPMHHSVKQLMRHIKQRPSLTVSPPICKVSYSDVINSSSVSSTDELSVNSQLTRSQQHSPQMGVLHAAAHLDAQPSNSGTRRGSHSHHSPAQQPGRRLTSVEELNAELQSADLTHPETAHLSPRFLAGMGRTRSSLDDVSAKAMRVLGIDSSTDFGTKTI